MTIRSFGGTFLKAKKFLNPISVIEDLDLISTDIVADYGCGVGFWTIPIAERTKKGKVYALSSNPEFVNLITSKARLAGLSNIETKLITLDEGEIKLSKKVDLVVISNMLHVTKNPSNFFKNAKKMLKPRGRILVIDFMKLKSIFGPPIEARFSEEEVILMAGKAGLHFKCTVEAGWYHYGLMFDVQR